MKFYNYTSTFYCGAVLGKINGRRLGLIPNKVIGGWGSSIENPVANFGLLSPTPDSWVHNKQFPLTWNYLVADHSGDILLEATVDPAKNRVFVGERAHLEGFRYPDQSNIPFQFLHADQRTAEQAFMRSLIPLQDYLVGENAGVTGFSLSEVISLDPIPVDQISVSQQQPLLEDALATTLPNRKELITYLTKEGPIIAELFPWRKTYEAVHGSLEDSRRRKER